MARPNKIGLDYFPLDVDFFEDEKMLAISGEFAVKGEIIVLRLLCEIYRNGYFVEYSELLKNKLARLGGLSGGLVDEVVSKLVKYGFFEGSLFSGENILTSKGIQKRFILASKRREMNLCCQYCLIKDINVCKNYLPDKVNVCKNAQIKGNKTKLNKIKKSSNEDTKNPPEIIQNWRTDFEIYLEELRNAYVFLKKDNEFIEEREKYHPNLDIKKSLEKACVDFWATERGWFHKKKSKTETIDWKTTFKNALNQNSNRVYKPRNDEQ